MKTARVGAKILGGDEGDPAEELNELLGLKYPLTPLRRIALSRKDDATALLCPC